MSIVGEGQKLVIDFENYRPGQDSESKDEGEGEIGDKDLAGGIEGKAGVLNADGEAYLKVGKDESNGKWDACIKGKALASVAEGSIEGKLKIRDFEIDVEGTGYALGAGAEFKGGLEKNKLNLTAKAALLFGAGVLVSVGLEDKDKK
ncbi:hypothetical protein [Clostridium sp. C2-6-12]|uniref:hypothetical protein n=1 Tax=Clostridium sp. C2-6-12 TaxID=2698832 RepID=UPI001A9A7748|nr:hypothetical protein [Clostridium sp. C2-6-12]